jgi:hypothetical protein
VPACSLSPSISALLAATRMGSYSRGSTCKLLKPMEVSGCALCFGHVNEFAGRRERELEEGPAGKLAGPFFLGGSWNRGLAV